MGTKWRSVLTVLRQFLIIACLITYITTRLAQSQPSCPKHPSPHCRGPYVIRPVRHTVTETTADSACQPEHEAEMTSCLRACQEDACCREFGLDGSGNCVTMHQVTETLQFVKETEEPYPESCLRGENTPVLHHFLFK